MTTLPDITVENSRPFGDRAIDVNAPEVDGSLKRSLPVPRSTISNPLEPRSSATGALRAVTSVLT